MRVLITCGPAWEPIDGMRRLTNASTGRLGTEMANTLAGLGHEVLMFRGEGATAALPRGTVEVIPFGTNDDLVRGLAHLALRPHPDLILHAAALCDFRVSAARGEQGGELDRSKIPSRAGRVTLELEPATKVLPRLREGFPAARIVGWKYELAGGPEDALQAAWRQLAEARTDACVLNGAAWGEGFALCTPPERVEVCANADALVVALLKNSP